MAAELSPQLQSLIESLQALKEDLDKVRAHHREAIVQSQSVESRAESNLATLGEAEVNHTLEGAPAPKKLRETVQASQLARTMLRARIHGFENRELEISEAITSTGQDLQGEYDAWARAEISRAHDAYMVAATRFAQDIAGPIAVGLALKDPRLGTVQRQAQLPSLGTGRNLLQGLTLAQYRSDPSMTGIITAYAEVQRRVKDALK